MKILQLCNKPPYPPVDGGTLAMNSITQGLLSEGHEVKVLSICTDKHPVQESLITDKYIQQTHFEAVYIDLNPHVLDAFVAWLCGESYNVKRYISKDFSQKLAQVLNENTFDIVQLEGLFLTPYVELIRAKSDARIILRAHNVENEIWQRMAKSCKNPIKKGYLKHLALTLRNYEIEHLNDYDALACIAPNDAEYFRKAGCRKPIIDIPFSVTPESLENVSVEENSLFHLGSMDWMPNLESIDWFLEQVWPALHKELPQVRLYLAGRKMPKRLMEAEIEGVSIVGEVPDAMYFIASKEINVVPLLSGSGIRVKIIEAMSAGKTVVTTTIGAQGIDCKDGEHLLIADTPEDFVRQIRHCVEDKAFCRQIGQNALNLIVERYSTESLTHKLTDFYTKIIES